MARTVVSSAKREVVIGFDQPFCVIGERINPTGRKKLAAEMAAGDFSTVERDALAQVEAGAHMLDVNAGIPLADEPAILAKTIQLVQSVTDVPLSIDSSIVAALEAGLAVYQGKAAGQLRHRRGRAPGAGAAADQEVRRRGGRDLQRRDRHLRGPRRALRGRQEDRRARRQDFGIPQEDVVVDPLVMPIGALGGAGRQAFEHRPPAARGARRQHHLRRLEHLLRPAEPARHERRLPAMVIGVGMTSAIMNPLHEEEMGCLRAADVLMEHDPNCRAWIKKYREPRPPRKPARPPIPAPSGRAPPPPGRGLDLPLPSREMVGVRRLTDELLGRSFDTAASTACSG